MDHLITKIKKINCLLISSANNPIIPTGIARAARNGTKAGIQVFHEPKRSWIPAFAGMTTERNRHYLSNSVLHLGIAMLGIVGIVLIPTASSAATVISVPFTSQAPAGNWAQPWQDFCEEASAVMSAHFLWGAPLTPKFAEMEMQIIKQYELLVFKKYDDTSAAETAMILTNLFGFKHIHTRAVASASDIKEEIAKGKLILAPAAGRLLKNPYFIAPGPLYHMIVIRGFDDSRHVFIVNDPGTRRGNGFAYDQNLLMSALHDWNGGDVMHGEKNVVVVER